LFFRSTPATWLDGSQAVTVLRELLDLGLVVARVLGPRGSCRLDLSFLIQLLLKTLVLLTHPLPRGAPLYLYYFFRDLTMGASIFFSARSLAVSKFVVPELFCSAKHRLELPKLTLLGVNLVTCSSSR
jgi:hypothetical protein